MQSWITKDRLPDAEQALKIAKQLNTSIEYLITGKNEEQKGIKQNLQDMIPKLNHLSDENLELIDLIAGRLK
ncbi:MAG: helix-turn-helix domain-containing protein [Treponema sp.]|nr:helix-turn-helix domain-containing protein [Spirochaetia bacterium]MDY4210985.1 helix-turn-helix domain-containing protein [Treponema sp.]